MYPCILAIHTDKQLETATDSSDKLEPEQNYVQYLEQHIFVCDISVFRIFWTNYLSNRLHDFLSLCISFTTYGKITILQLVTFIVFNLLSQIVCVGLH
jgi:hypothetical protein